jgi:hypothetical protein
MRGRMTIRVLLMSWHGERQRERERRALRQTEIRLRTLITGIHMDNP